MHLSDNRNDSHAKPNEGEIFSNTQDRLGLVTHRAMSALGSDGSSGIVIHTACSPVVVSPHARCLGAPWSKADTTHAGNPAESPCPP